MELSRRAQNLTTSATLAITQRAADLRAAGRNVISLGAGEPDFPTPESGTRAAIEAIKAGHTHYTACAGIGELREAIAEKLRRENGLDYGADEIIVGTGVKQCLYTALLTLTDPGDEVLMSRPYWVTYPAAAELVGAIPRYVNTDATQGFKLDPSQLEANLTPRTRVFLLNSPSNPTGAVYSREELIAIGEVLKKSSAWVVCDEIYEKLVFGDASHCPLAAACPDLADRVILLNGVSKAYAMTGWRIGYAAGPRAAIQAMGRAQSHVTSNATSVAQYAALGALTGAAESLQKMKETFSRRRDHLINVLSNIEGIRFLPPDGAFYAFPDISAWFDEDTAGSTALCRQILEEAEVAVVPGEAFGDDRCLRISYATSDTNLREALDRLTEFFARRSPKLIG